MKSIKLIVTAVFFCTITIAQPRPLTQEEQRVQGSIAKVESTSGGFDDFYKSLFKEKKKD